MKLQDQDGVRKSVRVGTKHYLVRNKVMDNTIDVVRDLYHSHPLNGSKQYMSLMESHWRMLDLLQVGGLANSVVSQVKVEIFFEDVGRLSHRVLCSLEVR